MVKIDDHTATDLDALALEHYNNLIGDPLADGVNYHATQSLIGRIRRQRDIDVKNGKRNIFWDYLLDNNFENLRRIIVSRPALLKEMMKEISKITSPVFFSKVKGDNGATLTTFGTIVKNVFNYASYRDGLQCKEFCEKFNLAYCPYCNEHTIQVIERTNAMTGQKRKQALLQLDHFYPQSRHPYLALSFFNLIPGCSTCNTQLKLEKNFDIGTHFNPFDKRLDDYFRFNVNSVAPNNETELEFGFENLSLYAPCALQDFEILNRYNHNPHKRLIYKMVKYFRHNNPRLVESKIEQLGGPDPNPRSALDDMLDEYNVPLTQKDINVVHLGKLKRDIARQLGILQE